MRRLGPVHACARGSLLAFIALLLFAQHGCLVTLAVRESHLRADNPQKELSDPPAVAEATYLGAYQDQWIIKATGLLRADPGRAVFLVIPFNADQPMTVTDRVEFDAHPQDPSVHVEFASTSPDEVTSFEYPYAVYLVPGDNTYPFHAMLNEIDVEHQPKKPKSRACEYDLERHARSTAKAMLRPLEYGLSVPADIALTPVYLIMVPIVLIVELSGGVCG